MNLKQHLKALLFFIVALSILSAAIPTHNIIHEHYFVHADTCGSSCEKHLKNYSKPCCTTSDAIFVADLPLEPQHLIIKLEVKTLETFYPQGNDFKFHHLTRNKAPPSIA